MKKCSLGYCCAFCGYLVDPPTEAVRKQPRASEHASNESKQEYPTEIQARIAIESDLAHPPLRITSSRKNYCHYLCPGYSYSAKREKVFVVTRSQHAPTCSAPKEHKNGARTSHFHQKTVELIVAPLVYQKPSEKLAKHKGVIGSAVVKVCERWLLPVVLLHAPSNENLDLWALLLKTLIEEVAPLEPIVSSSSSLMVFRDWASSSTI